MGDAELVRSRQGARHLLADIQGACDGKWPRLLDSVAQVHAFHVLHHDVGAAVFGGVEVIHAHRIRMLQLARDHGFRAETLQESIVFGEPAADHLECANLIEGDVLGFVDRRHAAGADAAQDLILVADHHAHNQL